MKSPLNFVDEPKAHPFPIIQELNEKEQVPYTSRTVDDKQSSAVVQLFG